jgi:putative toxin-antitoxin system antitoxin component (TIGR02293 family)
MLRIVEEQLPTSSINRLLALGLTRQEIDALVIPLRTLQHRRSKREKLTIEESDRVLRLARLLSQAEIVYGSRQRALEWLRRPAVRLKNRAPLDLMRTDTGARIVEEFLVQIDEGMFV